MPRGHCRRHGAGYGPCACSLGRLTRLVEPAVLFLLATGQATHGYEIIAQAKELYITESVIDAAAVYRVLRDLEEQGCVVSQWAPRLGPARRIYQITDLGRQRLELGCGHRSLGRQHQRFVARYRAATTESRTG